MPQAKTRRGNTLVEFALVASFILVPLVLGTMSIGMTMARTIRIYQITRDVAHMFARGVDFSQSANQSLLLTMATGLNITATGGDGVIILSGIQCTGAGQAVCTRRLVIGNSGLRASNYASPTQIDSSGNVNYTQDRGANASSFLNVMPMSTGESTYVVETYYASSDYDLSGFWNGQGTYTMAVF
jgi:Flp pilus assembly protein TadG